MSLSRRSFVTGSLATAAGACISRAAVAFAANAAADSLASVVSTPPNEDGSKLWLRYAPPPPATLAVYRKAILGNVVVQCESATGKIIGEELVAGLTSLLGQGTQHHPSPAIQDGSLIVGTAERVSHYQIAQLGR